MRVPGRRRARDDGLKCGKIRDGNYEIALELGTGDVVNELERLIADRWPRIGPARRARLAGELVGLSLELARDVVGRLSAGRAPAIRVVRAARVAARPPALPWIGPADVTSLGLLGLAARLGQGDERGRFKLFASAVYARRRAGRNGHLLLRRLLELGISPATGADEDAAAAMLRRALSVRPGTRSRAQSRDAAETSGRIGEPVTAILGPLSGRWDELGNSDVASDRGEARRLVRRRGARAAIAALQRRGWSVDRVRRAMEPSTARTQSR